MARVTVNEANLHEEIEKLKRQNAQLLEALEAAHRQGCSCAQITANYSHHTSICFIPKAEAALRAAKEVPHRAD